MDKTVTKAVSFEEQKADEYRYWQSVSPAERASAAWEMILGACHAKGTYEYGQELDRTLVSFSTSAALGTSSLAVGGDFPLATPIYEGSGLADRRRTQQCASCA